MYLQSKSVDRPVRDLIAVGSYSNEDIENTICNDVWITANRKWCDYLVRRSEGEQS